MKPKKLTSSFGIYESIYHSDSHALLLFGERQQNLKFLLITLLTFK